MIAVAEQEVPEKSKSHVFLECARLEEFTGNLACARQILERARVETKSEWKVRGRGTGGGGDRERRYFAGILQLLLWRDRCSVTALFRSSQPRPFAEWFELGLFCF